MVFLLFLNKWTLLISFCIYCTLQNLFQVTQHVPTPPLLPQQQCYLNSIFFLTSLNSWLIMHTVKICCIIYRSIKLQGSKNNYQKPSLEGATEAFTIASRSEQGTSGHSQVRTKPRPMRCKVSAKHHLHQRQSWHTHTFHPPLLLLSYHTEQKACWRGPSVSWNATSIAKYMQDEKMAPPPNVNLQQEGMCNARGLG